jgi:hypothetical protein
MVHAVTPQEPCAAFDVTFEHDPRFRRVLLRKLRSDIAVKFLPIHRQLLKRLEAGSAGLRGSKRLSAANALIDLVRTLSAVSEKQVLARLAMSRSASIRGQVFRRLKEASLRALPSFVAQSLRTFGDFEACRLLVERASVHVLRDCFSELELVACPSKPLLAKLYVRMKAKSPAPLRRLKRIDAVTRAYVSVMLGKRVAAPDLVELYKQEYGSDRDGLVAWCAGKMGHWRALQAMFVFATEHPEVPEPFWWSERRAGVGSSAAGGDDRPSGAAAGAAAQWLGSIAATTAASMNGHRTTER